MTDKQAIDRAVRLAFATAAHAHAMLCGPAAPADGFNLGWPTFGAAGGDDNQQLAADHLAPFVRANRSAPPEALYIHARGVRLHANRTPWAALPLHEAFAYALFVLVLNQTDARIAEDAEARELRDRVAASPLPIRDHTLERIDDGSDIFHQIGKPSKRNAKLPPPAPRRDDEPASGRQFADPRLDPNYKPPRRK